MLIWFLYVSRWYDFYMFLGGKTKDVMQPRILGISQIWHKLLTWSQVTFIMTPSFFCLLFYFWGIHLFSLDLFWLIVKWKLCINYSFIVNGDGSMVWSRKPWLKPFVLTIICIINITLKVKFHVTKWHVYNWWFFFFFFFLIGTVCIHSTENGRQQSPNTKL